MKFFFQVLSSYARLNTSGSVYLVIIVQQMLMGWMFVKMEVMTTYQTYQPTKHVFNVSPKV